MRWLRGWNTVPGLMIAIASIALVLALLRVEIVRQALFFPGAPVIGAILHRRFGGRGILGGAIGGLLGYSGFVISIYVWYILFPDPNLTDYLGPGLSLLAAAVYGSIDQRQLFFPASDH
jgi:hypothetical protein